MHDMHDMVIALARPVRHEANNLLAALSGTAEMMLRSRDATERDIVRAERLRDAAGRLQALLHAYLALGAPPPPDTPAAVVLEMMRPLVRLTVGPGRMVEVDAAEGLPALPAMALQAAMLELAADAADIAPPESDLQYRLEPAPGGAMLTVTASPGAQDLPPVFLPAAP